MGLGTRQKRQPTLDRYAVGGRFSGGLLDGLQFAIGLWLQHWGDAKRHLNRQYSRLDLGATGVCRNADRCTSTPLLQTISLKTA